VKRSAFIAAVTLAATLTVGVSAALAAPLPGSPLTQVAAHDGVSLPPLLARAITRQLAVAPAVTAAGVSQAPSQQQELQAPDGMPLDLFGAAVALSADGRTALVGAPYRTIGAAYVFVEQGGKWTLAQELQSPAGAPGDYYGLSVALSADGATALVGAPTGGSNQAGVVYSYARQGGTYVLNGQMAPADGAYSDEFGASVSVSGLGNVALVGAPIHNGYQGAAYTFLHGPRSWSQEREFVNPGVAGSAYGLSVSEAPDGLIGVVGAPLGNDVQGAAYVVSELNGSQQELVASDAAEGAFFGISVSMNALGTRVLVGSPFANLGDGAAYVFDNGKAGWMQSQEVVQSNPSGSDAFGYSVALDYLGNGALVGAIGRNGTDGSAYTFAGYPTLTQQRELDEPVAGSEAEYGFSVALDALGGQLLIGAPYQNNAQGAAWAAAS
jgi:trimeric autotransporter adhesin